MTEAKGIASMETDLLRLILSGSCVALSAGTASEPDAREFMPGFATTTLGGASPSAIERRMETLEEAIAALREQIEQRPTVYNAQLLDLGDVRYSLRFPLLVVVEAYPEEVVARVPEYNLYASGVSDAVAIARLKTEIVNTYERLRELGPEKLASVALQCLAAMDRIIEHTDGQATVHL